MKPRRPLLRRAAGDATLDQVDALLEDAMRARRRELREPSTTLPESQVLDSLPAQIAVLDANGVIVAVNQTWRATAEAGGMRDPHHGVGTSYLAVCENTQDDGTGIAERVAAGIRAVLAGTAGSISLEYPCHTPARQLWFALNITALSARAAPGAVLMHMDITQRVEAQRRAAYLDRVQAMLRGVDSMIVRVRSREELFQDSCRIAVEAGGFLCARIGLIDAGSGKVRHAGLACRDPELQGEIERVLAKDHGIPSPIVAQAIQQCEAIVANHSESDARVGQLGRQGQFGIRSKAVIPILLEGRVHGILSLYTDEIQFFHDEEVKLLTQLAGSIGYAIGHLENTEKLYRQAYYDAMTGLANQSLFLERVTRHLQDAAYRQRRVAVIVLDLERFKIINDSLGRSAGDALLQQVGEWLAFAVGDRERLARVDADHFAIVVPEVRAEEEVAAELERIVAGLRDHPFQLDEQSDFRIGARAGVALYPADGDTAEALFLHADSALRRSKAAGDRFAFYTHRMTEAAVARLSLESQLRQAVERQEFVLHYQPKVSLQTGAITGAEALIRWRDPRSGLVAPDRFIPVLEETGLICEVGSWALRQALADYRRWREQGLAAVPLAVNLSAVQLRDRGFMRQVAEALGTGADSAAGLQLEITESVIMQDQHRGVSDLQALHDRGIRIAIDDFGTGFSSLSYLSRLPVDELKIDRSFIAVLASAARSSALVSSIIHMAHALDLQVVAEGVETEAQATLLRTLDCDAMQGYLLSRPVPVEIFEQRFLAPAPAAG